MAMMMINVLLFYKKNLLYVWLDISGNMIIIGIFFLLLRKPALDTPFKALAKII